MTDNSRVRELLQAVDIFNDVHEGWSVDDNSPNPTLAYWRAFDRLIQSFETGDLPSECRSISTAVYDFGQERAVFDLSEDLHPHMKFWSAREKLRDEADKLRNPAGRSFLEPIKELHRQGVPHEQIARMWGLVNSDGSGKSQLVQQELDKPGSVITTEFVHPDELAAAQQANAARAKYLELSGKLRQVTSQAAQNADEPVCPETSEQLWQQSVPLAQAARMLKQSQSQVAKEWAGFKRIKDGNSAEAETNSETELISGETTETTKLLSLPTESYGNLSTSTELTANSQENSDDSDDRTMQFESWSDDEIKTQARDYGISIRGPFNREKLIQKILQAEVNGVDDEGQVNEAEAAPAITEELRDGAQV